MKIGKLLKVIRELLGKYAILYFAAVSIEQLFVVVCLNTVIAFTAQYAVKAAAEQDVYYLYFAVGMIGVAMIAAFMVIPAAGYLSNKWVKKALTNIKLNFFKHTMMLTKENSSKYHAGTIMSLFIDDVKQTEELYTLKIKNLLSVCFIGPISILALAGLNWMMGIFVLLFGVVSIAFTRFSAKLHKKISGDLQDAKGRVSSRLLDLLSGLEEAKTLSITGIIYHKYEKENSDVETYTLKRGNTDAVIALFSKFMYYFKEIVILAVGFLLMRQGLLTIDEIIASAFLLVNAGYMFDNIGIFYADVQKSVVSVERLTAFMEVEEERLEAAEKGKIIEIGNETGTNMIQFEQVDFSYDAQHMILNGVSFDIGHREYAAIVGASGNGKSTIIKLLLGFYDINDGDILINGQSVRTLSKKKLRELSAYVPQEPYLFPGTIRENIQFGNQQASQELIEEAAQNALCHDFVMQLSNQYDTVVGKESSFSGGQIQRIVIARALLKEAPILLLDEPTAALDAESEKQVLETICRLKGKRTIIVITHKMYTLTDCDKICALDKGAIRINEGTGLL